MRVTTACHAAALSIFFMFGCSSKHDGVGSSTAAIHGVSDTDTRFPAVGYLATSPGSTVAECTGTLIGPQLVLTAARCFGAYAQGCISQSEAIRELGTFVLSPSGDLSGDRITIAIDGVQIDPKAYSPSLANCALDAKHTCGSESASWPHEFGIHHSHDVAVVHLSRPVNPMTEAKPLEVITQNCLPPPGAPGFPLCAVGSNFLETGTGAVYASFVGDDYTVIKGIVPTVPGCGAGDDTANIRRAMDGHFKDGPSGSLSGHATGCVPPSDCNDHPVCGGKGQPICCAFDIAGLGVTYPDVVLHLARQAVSLGVFSGPAIRDAPLAAARHGRAPDRLGRDRARRFHRLSRAACR